MSSGERQKGTLTNQLFFILNQSFIKISLAFKIKSLSSFQIIKLLKSLKFTFITLLNKLITESL
jgi:hypothetical protein